ncbi:MAG TPA: AmmeMemoRadiSam system radical SAM enzyme [Syntrophorhabdaceae bacterium]|nr:AmmeMemoRadiSam system radical SAM enzyme [Syntrophorhabdaceae bacterium]
MKEALFYKKIEGNKVTCLLCCHHCNIENGKRGICNVRENREGILYTLVYGFPCSYHVDPIEKKPLFHFFPGSKAFSIATVGCNFKCLHCQNYEISQISEENKKIFGQTLDPEDAIDLALKSHCNSISYTYTEPTVFYEYAFDMAKIAKDRGLYNNFVTNGYIEDEPLRYIRPYLDAANIDLKGFNKDFYRRQCKAELNGVLEAIKLYKSLGIWIEITTLIIPGYNDDEREIKGIADFIKNEIGIETPWHVTAFYPTYKLLDAKRTPAKTLNKAREIGLESGLRYVYEGNIPGSEGEHTYCYNCKKAVIKRFGFSILEYNLKDGACIFCNTKIDGIGL